MARGTRTKDEMVRAAQSIVTTRGLARLTFDAVAAQVGVSKQAVIYWFPTKIDLVREIILPELRAETQLLVDAVADATSAPDAVARFVHACVGLHLQRLDLFRLKYLAAQLDPDGAREPGPQFMRECNVETSRMYGALADKLAADPTFRVELGARQTAVAIHMACLGFATMFGLADAIGDPMKHGIPVLVDTLVRAFNGVTVAAPARSRRRLRPATS